MGKNILQDVLTKRSIRRVPLPENRREGREDSFSEEALIYERETFDIPEEAPVRRSPRFLMWLAAVLFLAFLIVAVAMSFRGAVVTVTPKVSAVELNHEFVAQKNSRQANLLPFEVLPIEKSGERTIPADIEKEVSEKAKGTIVIYNNFSEKSQRLIKNTRFESPQGLIYRIDRSIEIPGRKKQGEKVTPGSLEVVVYADSPGEEYNISLADFTIPGFKSDPLRFKGFYARSKTPMSGGFEGRIKTPSDEALARARTEIRTELGDAIRLEIKKSIPEDFILFDDALVISTESLPLESKGNSAIVREKVTGSAYLFKQADLSRTIAERSLRSYNGLPVEIPNLSSLDFNFSETPLSEAAELRFTLSGSPQIVWTFDEQKLKDSVLGRERKDLATSLAAFPTIEKVDVVLRPFWSRSFPENPKKVRIERVSLGE